jgi:hypothetical protein
VYPTRRQAMSKARWAVFVHDPDGDMGFGTVVGAFHSPQAAEARAEKIQNVSPYLGVEAIVLPRRQAMAEAHARDSANERAFRDCARQIDRLLAEPRFEGRMSGRTIECLRAAREALVRDADHIVRVWN